MLSVLLCMGWNLLGVALGVALSCQEGRQAFAYGKYCRGRQTQMGELQGAELHYSGTLLHESQLHRVAPPLKCCMGADSCFGSAEGGHFA